MNSFLNNIKNFFISVFIKSKEVVVAPQIEDEYDGWLGV